MSSERQRVTFWMGTAPAPQSRLYHHFFQFLYYETKILVLTNWRFDSILNVVYQTHLSNSADHPCITHKTFQVEYIYIFRINIYCRGKREIHNFLLVLLQFLLCPLSPCLHLCTYFPLSWFTCLRNQLHSQCTETRQQQISSVRVKVMLCTWPQMLLSSPGRQSLHEEQLSHRQKQSTLDTKGLW